MKAPEAKVEKTEHGSLPTTAGWFLLNAADGCWHESPRFGRYWSIEGKGEARFQEVGVNIHMLAAGQRACLYHRESAQEGFLVLFGTCTLVVEDEERQMRQWDYFHCPPGVHHVFVGKSAEPCAILMLGRRDPKLELHYPVSEVAARHGASTLTATSDPRVAYEGTPPPLPSTARAPFSEVDS